ncbi:MAG TPA: glycosyltransferase family A protein [Acidisarcina sp.]
MPSSVCVCLLTHRRPELLGDCLRSLDLQLGLPQAGITMDVLVIDNDPAGSALPIYNQLTAGSTYRCRYLIEPNPGIPQARNRALDETASYDFVAFIDDDEIADPHWLANLVHAQRNSSAEIVCGPVLPRFEQVPDWVRRGEFFSPCDMPTGAVPKSIATNNVLLKRSALKDCRFDARFRYTGGSDTFFFMNLRDSGARAMWCNEARVSEIVSPSRANTHWLIERAYSSANRYTRSCQYIDPGLRTRVARFGIALAGIGLGLVKMAIGFWAKERIVKGMVLVARGFGTLHALHGSSYQYYAPEKNRD